MKSADGGASTVARDSLSISLGPGWQRVHAELLLSDVLARLTQSAYTTGLDNERVQSATIALSRVSDLYRENLIVFTAIRLRSDVRAIDQLILALPGDQPSISNHAARGTESSGGLGGELVSPVRTHGLQAVAHRSDPSRASTADMAGGSHVQLVFVIPGTETGAILTLISSAAGDEDVLERDAEEIASSVRLVDSDAAERPVAGC
jgi:hypothetical protein